MGPAVGGRVNLAIKLGDNWEFMHGFRHFFRTAVPALLLIFFLTFYLAVVYPCQLKEALTGFWPSSCFSRSMMTDDNWRRLCRMVSNEQDPHRLSELVDELIKDFDSRRQRLAQESPNRSDGSELSSEFHT